MNARIHAAHPSAEDLMFAAIRSAIRGRERWQIDALHARPHYAVALERELSRHAVIRHAWANPLTGRLLLVYDPGVQRDEVHDRVRASFGIAPATPGEVRDWRTTWPRGFNRAPEELAAEQARLRLMLSGTVFAGVLAKRLLLGAGMFAGAPGFVTANALLTILGGYTALRRGGISSRTLLSAITLSLLTVSESIDGIGALVFAHAGELLETRAVRDTHATIRMLDSWWEHDALPQAVKTLRNDPLQTAALLASGAALLVTQDPQRSLAMLVGASPVAGPESRITARALSLRHALANGILFRDPEMVSSLPRRPAIVIGGIGALRGATKKFGPSLLSVGAQRVILFTSEKSTAARAAARDAGLDEFRANLKSARKLDALEAIRRDGYAPVTVAGDEDNSTELLAASDVGMAVVSRSAPETLPAADVLLLENDPLYVAVAIALMRRTSWIVREDEWLSRLVGVGGFLAATAGKLNIAGAARLHNYTRLAMELNSLRLALPS
jgi:cation transport ATPase